MMHSTGGRVVTHGQDNADLDIGTSRSSALRQSGDISADDEAYSEMDEERLQAQREMQMVSKASTLRVLINPPGLTTALQSHRVRADPRHTNRPIARSWNCQTGVRNHK